MNALDEQKERTTLNKQLFSAKSILCMVLVLYHFKRKRDQAAEAERLRRAAEGEPEENRK